MSFQRKYPSLTNSTIQKLKSGESETLDFKLKPVGLSVDDLVAFANTDLGGEIFLGIEERKNPDGSQFGEPVGCDLSDGTILQITNKAISSIPPISIKLFAENIDNVPIIRVVIPTSTSKPHCTPKGIYLRRDGSRNRPLHPPELLKIFLESESRIFAERFQDTANQITDYLAGLQDSLTSSVDDMADKLGWVDSQLDNTESAMRSAAVYSKMANEESESISLRLQELFKQDKRDDPVYKLARRNYLEKILEKFRDDPDLVEKIKSAKGPIHLVAEGKFARELSESDLEEIFEEALKQFNPEEDNFKGD